MLRRREWRRHDRCWRGMKDAVISAAERGSMGPRDLTSELALPVVLLEDHQTQVESDAPGSLDPQCYANAR
jgi:hypothetical protein